MQAVFPDKNMSMTRTQLLTCPAGDSGNCMNGGSPIDGDVGFYISFSFICLNLWIIMLMKDYYNDFRMIIVSAYLASRASGVMNQIAKMEVEFEIMKNQK